jgi:membrane protein implicated in regulation of membrane protease activity
MFHFTILWVVVASIAAAAALKSRSLAPLPLGVAAAGAFVADVLGEGLLVSIFVLVVLFVLGRWVIRPAVRLEQGGDARVKPGTGSLVGKPAVVVERISNSEAVGCVRIDDEIWTARTWEDGEVLEPGARVHVVELRGTTAVVSF